MATSKKLEQLTQVQELLNQAYQLLRSAECYDLAGELDNLQDKVFLASEDAELAI